MLMLLLSTGDETYAVDVARVTEIVPLVEIQNLPRSPAYVPGLLNYHGRLVPIVDLSHLIHEKPCSPRLSTRIVLLDAAAEGETPRLLGLMAERVVETIEIDRDCVTSTNVNIAETPYLGEMIADARGMIPRLRVDHLLPESVRQALAASEAHMQEKEKIE